MSKKIPKANQVLLVPEPKQALCGNQSKSGRKKKKGKKDLKQEIIDFAKSKFKFDMVTFLHKTMCSCCCGLFFSFSL